MALFAKIAEEIDAGRRIALATIIQLSGSPDLIGGKMIISERGLLHSSIGGEIGQKLQEAGLEQLEKGQSAELKVHLSQSSSCRLFVHVYNPAPRLLILGGGHIGQALCKMAGLLDFKIVIIDDRPSFANLTVHPEADQIICEPFEKGFDQLEPSPSDYIVIVTRGHQHDRLCLEKALKRKQYAYLGMIGSKRRVKAQRQELARAGYSKEQLESVYSPIGLPISAVTEFEIALSILAEITSVRRGKNRGEEMHEEVMHELISLEEKGTRAVLATIIGATGSTPRKRGSQMIIFPDGRLIGTIGGGCAEADVRREAMACLDKDKAKLVKLDLDADAAAEQGMACGGRMEILLELLPVQYCQGV